VEDVNTGEAADEVGGDEELEADWTGRGSVRVEVMRRGE
jgi:hypothetical protein